MSNINPIDGTSCTIDFYSDPNALSADALLLYCSRQLNSFDSDIKGYLNQQRSNLTRKKALGDIENTMKKYTEHLDPTGQQECWDTWNKAINSLPPGDPLRSELQAKFQKLTEHQAGFTKEEWSGYIGDVHSMLEDVNGNAEINMIQLQSVMSQRQTAVQLTTSLLSKFDEGLKSVVSNIGR